MKRQYIVEFYDSFQGTCTMEVKANSEKAAMNAVNKLLRRKAAMGAYLN